MSFLQDSLEGAIINRGGSCWYVIKNIDCKTDELRVYCRNSNNGARYGIKYITSKLTSGDWTFAKDSPIQQLPVENDPMLEICKHVWTGGTHAADTWTFVKSSKHLLYNRDWTNGGINGVTWSYAEIAKYISDGSWTKHATIPTTVNTPDFATAEKWRDLGLPSDTKLLVTTGGCCNADKGDILVLSDDDGSTTPFFTNITKGGRACCLLSYLTVSENMSDTAFVDSLDGKKVTWGDSLIVYDVSIDIDTIFMQWECDGATKKVSYTYKNIKKNFENGIIKVVPTATFNGVHDFSQSAADEIIIHGTETNRINNESCDSTINLGDIQMSKSTNTIAVQVKSTGFAETVTKTVDGVDLSTQSAGELQVLMRQNIADSVSLKSLELDDSKGGYFDTTRESLIACRVAIGDALNLLVSED